MRKSHIGSIALLTMVTIAVAGCSRVGADWKAAQAADTTEAYQDFLHQHPDSEFGLAAQERVRQLAEERDWEQASRADTLDAYQQFVAAHADGKWAQEARVRIENFQLTAAAAAAAPASPANPAGGTKPATHGTAAATAGKSPGKHLAQLGAYSSKASAESAWHQLSSRFPAQLKSLQPHYATIGGAKPLVRLQVALPTSQRVHELCAQLKQHSQACLPLS